MNGIMVIILSIIGSIIGTIIVYFIWGPSKIKDRFSIKKKVEVERDKQVTTGVIIQNTGMLSVNKGPIYISQPGGNYTFKDNQQINIFHISGSTSMIMAKDLSVPNYYFSVTGSAQPSISTSTDYIPPDTKDNDINNETEASWEGHARSFKLVPSFFWSSNHLVDLLQNLIGPHHIEDNNDLTRGLYNLCGNRW